MSLETAFGDGSGFIGLCSLAVTLSSSLCFFVTQTPSPLNLAHGPHKQVIAMAHQKFEKYGHGGPTASIVKKDVTNPFSWLGKSAAVPA